MTVLLTDLAAELGIVHTNPVAVLRQWEPRLVPLDVTSISDEDADEIRRRSKGWAARAADIIAREMADNRTSSRFD